ncbi:MAG: four helix bundle protein [Prevotella sp.]|nr:four helix bundle protein [Prevotella sp.]
MVDNNVLAEKTLNFAVRVVKCCHYLQEEKKDFVISNQLLRSGTSVGANVHEAVYAQSKADFISKLSIALKEASETSFWLVLLYRTDYLEEKVYVSLKSDIDEIIRITVSSIKTTRKNEKYMGD